MNEANRIRAGHFIIDIDTVSMSGLDKIRKLVPRADYRIIRSRKRARVNRRRKKNEAQELDQRINDLKDENLEMKKEIE